MKYKKTGVPRNYRHLWRYLGVWDERKVKKGLWRFTFKANKSHKGKKSYGNFGKGTTGIWDIRAKQYITKTGKGSYITKMIGYKKPLKFNVRKPYKRGYRR